MKYSSILFFSLVTSKPSLGVWGLRLVSASGCFVYADVSLGIFVSPKSETLSPKPLGWVLGLDRFHNWWPNRFFYSSRGKGTHQLKNPEP